MNTFIKDYLFDNRLNKTRLFFCLSRYFFFKILLFASKKKIVLKSENLVLKYLETVWINDLLEANACIS
ncbi:hypothetical protein SDC9_77292 [bioreactor metagenome]|uniref:Uncharacterized protein n=1 Tax=bioreactor metagenome TaxID=1076179 RepID=A0A644YQ50_9ZZZZ